MKRQETMRGRSSQNRTERQQGEEGGGEEVFWWLGGRRDPGGLEGGRGGDG